MHLFHAPRHPTAMSLDAPRGADAVAKRLVEILHAPASEIPAIRPIGIAAAPRRVVAVDGSSVTLAASGDLLLVAYRAARAGVENGHALPPEAPAPTVALLSARDARDTVADALAAEGIPADMLDRMDARAALDTLRGIEEARAAHDALDTMREGDALLLDGALQARAHAPLLDRALTRAARQKVDVIGVCKSTSLTIGRAPALVACQLAARPLGRASWMAQLPTPLAVRGASYAARLSPAETRAFRYDIASERAAEDVLAGLSALCGHPAYPGYPSPLAMAHNAALLNEDARVRLHARVQEAALKAGVDHDAWDAAFVDYHDILELGA